MFSEDTIKRISDLDRSYPGLKEWRTKDLFKRRPTKPNFWCFHGRKDDILVLSNGEKVYPILKGPLLQGHPFVARPLLSGKADFKLLYYLNLNRAQLMGIACQGDLVTR